MKEVMRNKQEVKVAKNDNFFTLFLIIVERCVANFLSKHYE